MSLFAARFWIPSSIEFGARFLDTGLNFYDSLVATLICTLFSGIQLCMCRRIVQLHARLQLHKGRSRRQNIQSLLLTGTSILFAISFIASALIYCIQFSRNVLALRTVGAFSEDASKVDNWPSYRGCSSGPGARCVEVPLWKLQLGRRMELAYAALIQGLIILTDTILVARCYFVFFDRPAVFYTALSSLLASFGVFIFGLVSLSKAGGLSGGSSWNFPGDSNAPAVMSTFIEGTPLPAAELPSGYFPGMSIISSLVVNAIVTISIVSRMIAARRRLHDCLPMSPVGDERKDDVYTSAAALLIESALPPVVFGVLAAVFSAPSVGEARKVFDFELAPKVAWVAFTALAPQLILVRILQGRAWNSAHTLSLKGGMMNTRTNNTTSTPITFSRRESEDFQLEDESHEKKRSSIQSEASTQEATLKIR